MSIPKCEGVVWKWQLPRQARFALAMPPGSRILHVAGIGGESFIWALVNPDTTERVAYNFERRLTGTLSNPISMDAEYVGACIEDGGAFVGHIFKGDPFVTKT